MSNTPHDKRPTAQEVIQFAEEQKRLLDIDVDVDVQELARLDEMPEEEAAALIDRTMAAIFLS